MKVNKITYPKASKKYPLENAARIDTPAALNKKSCLTTLVLRQPFVQRSRADSLPAHNLLKKNYFYIFTRFFTRFNSSYYTNFT